MAKEWQIKSAQIRFNTENEELNQFAQDRSVEFAHCLADFLRDNTNWNVVWDLFSVLKTWEHVLERLPANLRRQLCAFIDTRREDPASLIVGIDFGKNIVQTAREYIRKADEQSALVLLRNRLRTTKDRTITRVLEHANDDELLVAMKALPTSRIPLISNVLAQSRLDAVSFLLDSTFQVTPALVKSWIANLDQAEHDIDEEMDEHIGAVISAAKLATPETEHTVLSMIGPGDKIIRQKQMRAHCLLSQVADLPISFVTETMAKCPQRDREAFLKDLEAETKHRILVHYINRPRKKTNKTTTLRMASFMPAKKTHSQATPGHPEHVMAAIRSAITSTPSVVD